MWVAMQFMVASKPYRQLPAWLYAIRTGKVRQIAMCAVTAFVLAPVHVSIHAQEHEMDAGMEPPSFERSDLAGRLDPRWKSALTQSSRHGSAAIDATGRRRSVEDTRRYTMAIMFGGALGVALYGKSNWWQEGFTGHFQTVNEGWFGQHTYAGGADKLGHFYSNYSGTRLLARAFEWAGNEHEESVRLGAAMALGTFTAVEVIDGYSKRWRFSKEDALMNAAGAATALLLESHPQLDSVVDLRMLYQPSREGRHNFDPFGDYSGQTYLLVAKASGVPAWREHPWLRYLEFAVGYGSRGYEADPALPPGERSRNVYVGVTLNLSELLRATAFRGATDESRAQYLTNTLLEFVQIPGTGAFASHTLRKD